MVRSGRRSLLAALLALSLAIPLAMLVLSGPAQAAVSASVQLTLATCPHDGNYGNAVYLREDMAGLPGSASTGYHLGATRDIDADNSFTLSENYWYADAPSYTDHHVTTTELIYNGGPKTVDLQPGDQYSWTLYEIAGSNVAIASGVASLAAPTGCAPSPSPSPSPGPGTTGAAPAAASFAASPHAAKVGAAGTFRFPFGATAGTTAAVVVTRAGAVWATSRFTVDATGRPQPVLKLTKAGRRYLAARHKATTTVTVTLSNSSGSTPASTTLRLRRP